MVCFSEDDYIQELQCDRKQAIWRALLSDGRSVFMDDGRPGIQPYSAWLRLGNYLKDTKLKIVELWPQFRSNSLRQLPTNADGYYFSKSAIGHFTVAETFNFFLLGALTRGRLVVQRVSVPELVLTEIEERDPATAGERLILNDK